MKTIVQLRLLSEAGQIEKAIIVDAIIGSGFNILVKLRSNLTPELVRHSIRDEARVYKTIDACVKSCRAELGLRGTLEIAA
jgi:hypothetical protein